MTADEFFDQQLNKLLAQKLGTDYGKFNDNISSLIKASSNNYEEIKNLKMMIKKLNDNQIQLAQQMNTQITEYNNILKKISALEEENRRLSQKISEKDLKSAKIQSSPEIPARNVLLNQSGNNMQKEQTNNIIRDFNNWAAHPISVIPGEFAYLVGEFRIRTNQQELTETKEETKWIINRGGGKKYLLPNPNFFDQMTNISELYKMDLSMLKEKGKNKIKVITPCEISSSGFIELPGELKFL